MLSSANLPSTISDPTPPALSATYAYDARKNMAFNGRLTMSYDLKGNLATASGSGMSASYAYNAFSQRVKKTVGSTSTYYAYDEAGNLAGEYSASGARLVEHVYLGSLPIGVVFGSGPAQTMAVHADYLGTPRTITNGSTIMWKWDSIDPFGANLPSVQSVVYNLRFPGQYYDAETGLHYNHYRTYDPSLGRYLQPDPLGLAAGKNPFNYVNQSPLNGVDRQGLDIEVIHIIDNTFKGRFVDHIALVVNGKVYETQMAEGTKKDPDIWRWGLPMKTNRIMNYTGVMTRSEFLSQDKYSGLTYESFTLSSSKHEEERVVKYYSSMRYTNTDSNGGRIIYGIEPGEVACASSAGLALSGIGFPYIDEVLPSRFYPKAMANYFFKKRIVNVRSERKVNE